MDEHNQPRRLQNEEHDTFARLGNTSSSTSSGGASPQPSGRQEVDAQETRRFTVELRAADGQAVSRTAGNDAWRALQEFSGFASQDLGRRLGTGAGARLSDRDGVYGVQLEVDNTGANQLKFDTDEGRALYKQVYRERQLAVSQAPMSNRIEAVAPELDQTTAYASLRDTVFGGAFGKLREAVLKQLEQRPQPETKDEEQRLERDRQIVARASFGQLGLIAIELAKDEPNQLRKVLDQVQERVETSVGQNTPEQPNASSTLHGRTADRVEDEPSRTVRPVAEDPPIRERFTAIEHAWRTDYWQRDRPDRLGFTESWLTLKTAEHSAAVIMGMVDRARERGWTKLHLDGSPEFKREAWILATARGLQTSGYTATLGDPRSGQGRAATAEPSSTRTRLPTTSQRASSSNGRPF